MAFLKVGLFIFMKNTILLPKNVEYIIDTFYNAGYKAYAVGGCSRDSLMGNTPNDWDICTNALPNQVKQVFSNHQIIDTGLKHGTVTLLIDKTPYEITTFRTESTYSDNRRPDSVMFVSTVQEDLSRRDFTVNAIAYNQYEYIIDPFGGQEDIKNAVIRTVGNPDTRFNEDALRILRAIRFASTLGFSIENETKESIHKNKLLLKNIAVERIWAEFKKLIVGKNSVEILREFADVIAVFIPDIIPMIGFNQNNPMHCYDVWEHTLSALQNAEQNLSVRLSVLFHDIGKPLTYFEDEKGIGHFYGHHKESKRITLDILTALKAETKLKNEVATLVYFHDRIINPTEKSVKRMIFKIGSAQLFEKYIQIKLCDIKAQTPSVVDERIKIIEEVIMIYNRLQNDNKLVTTVKDLSINGNDIILLGEQSGKNIGKILNELLEQVINNQLENRREELLEMAQILVNRNKTLK